LEVNVIKNTDTKISNLHLGIANDASMYTIATSISSIIVFMSGLIIKRYLGPTDFGVWSLVYIILTYLILLDFGSIAAANKEIPYEHGKADERSAEVLKGTLFTFIGFIALIVMGGILFYIAIDPVKIHTSVKVGLFCIAVSFPLFQLQQALTTILWINKEFRKASMLVLIEALSNSIIGILLVWMYGLYGMYAAFIVTLTFKVVYLLMVAKQNKKLAFHLKWDWASFERLIRKGVPLQIAGCINLLKVSLATLLIGKYINIAAVGYYAFAVSIQNFILLGPNAFWIIMFPRFQERFAVHNEDVSVLESFFVKPLIGFTFFLLPLMISFSYLLVPPIIRHILPAFLETIPVLHIMLIGTFFFSMECIPGQIMVTTNNLWTRSVLGLFNTAIIILLILLLISYNKDILSFTSAIAIGNFIGFIVNYLVAHNYIKRDRTLHPLGFKMLLAFLYVFATIVVIDIMIPVPTSTAGDFVISFLKWIVSLIIMLPLFVVAERNLSLVATFKSLFFARQEVAS